MIGKVSLGRSFSGCIAYCLEDKKLKNSNEVVFKHRAEIILYNRCFGNKKELIRQFNDQRSLNAKLEKPVMHVSLSFAPGERIERDKLIGLVQDCAKNLGFENNQFLAVAHSDTNHQHLHLVVNRINSDVKTLSDSNNYKKIAGYCRQMEVKYDLKQLLSPRAFLSEEQRSIPRIDVRKEKFRENLKQCLYDSRNYQEFEMRVKEKGYQVIKGRGISFLDDKGVKIKGSDVGYSLMQIEKIFENKLQLQGVEEVKQQNQGLKQDPLQEIGKSHEFLNDITSKRIEPSRSPEHKILDQKENILVTALEIILSPEKTAEQLSPGSFRMKKRKKQSNRPHW